jgi:outer membrane receptor protein involved in Fe transport
VRTGVTQQSTVRETSAGLYADNATTWAPWFRSVAGLRADHYDFDVNSSIAANSGHKRTQLGSPKLSLIFGPWDRSEYFVNYGWGFHSNDARGVTETVTPKEGLPADPSPGLVRSKGGELGLRTQIVPGLQTSISLWQLNLASELVFSGDAGDTEASGASRRRGLEVSNHYIAAPWLLFDADLSFSQARFDQPQGEAPNLGRSIPGSVGTVASFGATVVDRGPWFGQFQLRYFGPRPLIEDDSVRSHATTLAYLRVGYKLAPDVKVAFDVFNLFDQKSSDIDYYYASRLQGEPADGVNDIHFHPVEPRSLRVTLTAAF